MQSINSDSYDYKKLITINYDYNNNDDIDMSIYLKDVYHYFDYDFNKLVNELSLSSNQYTEQETIKVDVGTLTEYQRNLLRKLKYSEKAKFKKKHFKPPQPYYLNKVSL